MLSPAASMAHTVSGRAIDAKPAVVEFRYSNGEPMAHAEVAVFGPADSEPYQTGRADALGRFAFVADRDGAWRVEARDEEKACGARGTRPLQGYGGAQAHAKADQRRVAGQPLPQRRAAIRSWQARNATPVS